MVIYINLWNDFAKKDVVAHRILKCFSATPAITSAERLEVIYNSHDNYDHIQTSDYEYKRWNTFIEGKAPNAIAFGIKGNFQNNLRASMSVFRSLWTASASAKNFSMMDVLMKLNENPTSICFNIRLVGVILEYIQTGNWAIDRSGEFNNNYNQFSLALQYITSESMEDVQEFLFSRYKILEIYLANDRCSTTQPDVRPFKIAEYATNLLRSQTNVLGPDDFHNAIMASGITSRDGYKRYVDEVSMRSHTLNDFFQDGAYFENKVFLDQETESILSRTDFPQFASIATRPSSQSNSSEFEFVVPCQILSFDDDPMNVYIKTIVVRTHNTKWMSDILSLLYPDVTQEQWKTINSGLVSLI